MTITDIAHIINPLESIIHNDRPDITRLCYDSRKVDKPDETLFFAFKTSKNDGHRYIPELARIGVHNFVVSDFTTPNLDPEGNFLIVSDPLAALQTLAKHHRSLFHYPVIGITGSNGKTIVKEWLNTMLNDDYLIVRSPDSYNSQIGVPLVSQSNGKEKA